MLLTQARDKNYLDSLQSDSLIKIAVDYYKDDGVKAGKALFYYGKVAALQDNDTLAIQAYLSALAKLEKTEEYKMMALVHQYVGRLNDDSEMYDMALDNYRKSIFYNKKVGDTLKMVYTQALWSLWLPNSATGRPSPVGRTDFHGQRASD